uniref:Thyroglobulin type-1 domain-containing protein n=2 Tax=Salmo trutta TaxID=8032 RepID=A0A674AL83_SALTR
MATLTIILLISTVFALGDAMKRPKTPCERARDAVINGPPGVYVPTCDCQGEYTPEQHWGSTGYRSLSLVQLTLWGHTIQSHLKSYFPYP